MEEKVIKLALERIKEEWVRRPTNATVIIAIILLCASLVAVPYLAIEVFGR